MIARPIGGSATGRPSATPGAVATTARLTVLQEVAERRSAVGDFSGASVLAEIEGLCPVLHAVHPAADAGVFGHSHML